MLTNRINTVKNDKINQNNIVIDTTCIFEAKVLKSLYGLHEGYYSGLNACLGNGGDDER